METNDFVTDPELTTYLNNSLCLLDGILITKFNDYKLTSTFAQLEADQDYLLLPTDFLKLRGLDVQIGDGYHTLTEYQFRHRNRRLFNGVQGSFGPHCLQYRLEDNKVKVHPPEQARQYQFQVWYVRDYIPLQSPSDTLQPYMDSQAWYEYAITDSAIKVLEKQDLDTQVFERQASLLRDHIQKLSSPNRNSAEPASITDSRAISSPYPYGWSW